MKQKVKCQLSSGNVFADLGIENPEEELAKAKACLKTGCKHLVTTCKDCGRVVNTMDFGEDCIP